MKILLIGPQGSGKSTQADLLSLFLNIPKISTGDIFRELSRKGSGEAKRVKEVLSQGKLIDDETTSAIVKSRLSQDDCKGGFILDGYPRNIRQIEMFDPGFDKVIYLKVSDEEVVKRLMARGREDDTPGIIQTRLNLYREQTQPLLDYYSSKGILIEIDGQGSIERVRDEIRKYF